MFSRGSVIAALVVVELAIVGEAAVAVRGGQSGPPAPPMPIVSLAVAAPGSHLAEGGAHQTFDAGAHPALSIDIGYADLTIVARESSQIDVALSKSTDFGIMRSTAPVSAVKDGDTVRVEKKSADSDFSVGDNRMVTVIVPPQTRVTVVHAGDIKVSGLRAETQIRSVGQGSVSVDDFDAPSLDISTRGKITLAQVAAVRIDATSRDGRIEATGLRARDGSIDSDGRATLAFAAGSDTVVTAQADDGSVNLSGFPATSIVPTVRKAGSDDDSSLQAVRVGAGNGRLAVHAGDGNITLTQ